ncbi:hypothetical protein ACIGEP_13125 [Microbacterium sp. NPDC077663]|uniref:hypothetical protein n=1 Tax=Microbacterium sp. NPDC077663 TaxID=3364189 RepID=UPI0037CCC107
MTDEDNPMKEAASDMSAERRSAERGVGMASYWFVLSLAFVYLSVSGAVPGSGTAWFVVVGCALTAVGCIALGIARLRFRARKIAAFEAQYGTVAGRKNRGRESDSARGT